MSNEQSQRFHAPLLAEDAADKTVGCRHTQPKICAKHSMPRVCAFITSDGICYAPPKSWPKQFEKLKYQGDQ